MQLCSITYTSVWNCCIAQSTHAIFDILRSSKYSCSTVFLKDMRSWTAGDLLSQFGMERLLWLTCLCNKSSWTAGICSRNMACIGCCTFTQNH